MTASTLVIFVLTSVIGFLYLARNPTGNPSVDETVRNIEIELKKTPQIRDVLNKIIGPLRVWEEPTSWQGYIDEFRSWTYSWTINGCECSECESTWTGLGTVSQNIVWFGTVFDEACTVPLGKSLPFIATLDTTTQEAQEEGITSCSQGIQIQMEIDQMELLGERDGKKLYQLYENQNPQALYWCSEDDLFALMTSDMELFNKYVEELSYEI